MTQIRTAVRFLIAAVANLISDVAQIEAAVPTVTGILGVIAATTPASGTVGRIVGGVVSVGSAIALALPKISTGLKQAESDLETLLGHAQARPK